MDMNGGVGTAVVEQVRELAVNAVFQQELDDSPHIERRGERKCRFQILSCGIGAGCLANRHMHKVTTVTFVFCGGLTLCGGDMMSPLTHYTMQ
ncbi:hypothetical protein SAMD00023353_1301820 [Rosellinia necatrix]|uniref:Uncharacterized protein n=1 Tax=Rosellinia necatrix TaxID=77044 RepID=A0A1W2TC78_ROSNE|nr:hypothetical protein SAMD00023353_1301820 [Rosellinia necatrix]